MFKHFQKALATQLHTRLSKGCFPPGYAPMRDILPENVLRKRWEDNLRCIPKHTLNKCISCAPRSIRTINENPCVPPRVAYAAIKLFYHGWPPRHRCGVLRHRCLMCGLEQGDSVDHIIRCSFTRRAYARYGVRPLSEYRAEVFLLCDFRFLNGANLTVCAVLAAALYKLLNKLRHGSALALIFDAQLDRYIDDSIQGHSAELHEIVHSRRWSYRSAQAQAASR